MNEMAEGVDEHLNTLVIQLVVPCPVLTFHQLLWLNGVSPLEIFAVTAISYSF